MIKIGMIGIGDIAKKAYLPVLSQYDDISIHMCTRNEQVLSQMAATYNIEHTYRDIDELTASGIEAAFVHAATDAHETLVDKLLDNNIHVFVDKPITYDAESARRLVRKAQERGLIFMVGFNRRYASAYKSLFKLSDPSLVMVQKHRDNLPGDVSQFVYDDFIHVIDTMLNFFPYTIEKEMITGKFADGQLYHIVLQLHSKHGTAIGIMNRDAGMNVEKTELFTHEGTAQVKNINEVSFTRGRTTEEYMGNDWEPTLKKRGFHDMTRIFIDAVKNDDVENWDYEIDLKRHLLAERIVNHFKS